MVTTHCPACSGPLPWHEDTVNSLVGGIPEGGSSRTLADLLDEHATGALRAAVRALEDAAAGVRWRMTRADAPPQLDEELVRLEQEVAVLNELVRPRARAVPTPAPRQRTPARRLRAEVA